MFVQLAFGIAAFVLGICLSFQGVINASLARGIGSGMLAATISFGVGFFVLAVAAALSGQFAFANASWRSLPLPYWFLGGMIGASFVALVIFAVPRIGIGSLTAFTIAGQLIAAAIIDHFGLLGVVERGMTLVRAAGMLLLFIGGLMVSLG